MKKTLIIVLALMMALTVLVGCSPKAAEPKTYTATSKTNDYGSNATLTITYDGKGKITDVKWEEFSNGVLKDETYGKDFGDEAFTAAQISVNGSKTYGETLKSTGDISKVESVSGATQSYNRFIELYNEIQSKIGK